MIKRFPRLPFHMTETGNRTRYESSIGHPSPLSSSTSSRWRMAAIDKHDQSTTCRYLFQRSGDNQERLLPASIFLENYHNSTHDLPATLTGPGDPLRVSTRATGYQVWNVLTWIALRCSSKFSNTRTQPSSSSQTRPRSWLAPLGSKLEPPTRPLPSSAFGPSICVWNVECHARESS